jgi:hypothetical protein
MRRGVKQLAIAVITSLLALPSGLAAGPPASASLRVRPAANPGAENYLTGVKTLTKRNAWAVGWFCPAACVPQSARDLIEHWNGATWSRVASPEPGTNDRLTSISASSAGDLWAVGTYENATGTSPLVLHSNGSKWTKVALGLGVASLTSVYARTPGDVWIVGSRPSPRTGDSQTLILHWNGRSLKQVTSPDPGPIAILSGVAGSSASNVWAVGQYCAARCGATSAVDRGLAIRWTGRKWTRVPPPAGSSQELGAIAVLASDNAWTAGLSEDPGHTLSALILHWTGTRWSKVKTPDLPPTALAFASATQGWGVAGQLSLRWSAGAWTLASIPVPGTSAFTAVSAAGLGDLWAVGSYCASRCETRNPAIHALAVRWNGRSWHSPGLPVKSPA